MKNSNSSLSTVGTITCPNCKNVFDASEILVHRIKENLQKEYKDQFDEIKKLKSHFEKQHAEIEVEIQKGIDMKWKTQKLLREKELRRQLDSENSEQIKSYQEQLKEQGQKTRELLRLKAELEKQLREKEIMKEQLEAEHQSRLTKEVAMATIKIKSDFERTTAFELAAKDHTIHQLSIEINNAKRRIEQGSQQLQGEAAELIIEKWLEETYPGDSEPIGKGLRGADAILTVKNNFNAIAGKIVFEIKKVKTWQKDFVEKFRDDIRKVSSGTITFGILVTEVYPKGVTKMTQIEDVWICSFNDYQNLTVVLRQAILLLHEMQNSHKNKGTKMELMHQFLTGPQFKSSVESIIRSFTALKGDLDKEKAALQGYWKARELQLDRVLTNTAEMYHSVRSIIGAQVPSIKQLEGGGDKSLQD